jgi:hypothetical protein
MTKREQDTVYYFIRSTEYFGGEMLETETFVALRMKQGNGDTLHKVYYTTAETW